LPAEASILLRQLLALTQTFGSELTEAELTEAELSEDVDIIERWLEQRQALLDQLAALPAEQRSLKALSPEDLEILNHVRQFGDALILSLEARRQELNISQGELRQTHSALRAYMPDAQAESHYIEEET
jgi:prefoldin subunit 5